MRKVSRSCPHRINRPIVTRIQEVRYGYYRNAYTDDDSVRDIKHPNLRTVSNTAPVLASVGEASVLTTTVSLQVDDGSAALFATVRALDAAGIPARNVVVREPSLDDVFLRLTGATTS